MKLLNIIISISCWIWGLGTLLDVCWGCRGMVCIFLLLLMMIVFFFLTFYCLDSENEQCELNSQNLE